SLWPHSMAPVHREAGIQGLRRRARIADSEMVDAARAGRSRLRPEDFTGILWLAGERTIPRRLAGEDTGTPAGGAGKVLRRTVHPGNQPEDLGLGPHPFPCACASLRDSDRRWLEHRRRTGGTVGAIPIAATAATGRRC